MGDTSPNVCIWQQRISIYDQATVVSVVHRMDDEQVNTQDQLRSCWWIGVERMRLPVAK